jgi:hypothetical protein
MFPPARTGWDWVWRFAVWQYRDMVDEFGWIVNLAVDRVSTLSSQLRQTLRLTTSKTVTGGLCPPGDLYPPSP